MLKAALLLVLIVVGCVVVVEGINCDPAANWNNNPSVLSGTSSWFDAVGQGGGACGYKPDTNDRYVAAYGAPTVGEMCVNCGSCFNVTGPQGSTVVRIIDYCDVNAGQCTSGSFTLDQVPYTIIAGSTSTGSVSITYFPVACPYDRNLEYAYGDGGNQQWYTAVRVNWHRYPLASFEIKTNGTTGGWASLPRQSNNVWWYNPAPNPQKMPAQVRVNDTAGHTIIDTLPDFQFSLYTGTAQFPYLSGGTGTGSSGSSSSTSAAAGLVPCFLGALSLLFVFVLFW